MCWRQRRLHEQLAIYQESYLSGKRKTKEMEDFRKEDGRETGGL